MNSTDRLKLLNNFRLEPCWMHLGSVVVVVITSVMAPCCTAQTYDQVAQGRPDDITFQLVARLASQMLSARDNETLQAATLDVLLANVTDVMLLPPNVEARLFCVGLLKVANFAGLRRATELSYEALQTQSNTWGILHELRSGDVDAAGQICRRDGVVEGCMELSVLGVVGSVLGRIKLRLSGTEFSLVWVDQAMMVHWIFRPYPLAGLRGSWPCVGRYGGF
ncbi:hypothetical protein F5Y04DRAFT_275510 [Hypomontagnella monticulosa]|nr:hypothetical protein F5Y04DRAFT_275510 [Hypomontagnella monticulosa]